MGARWYAVLLIPPAAILAVLLALRVVVSRAFAPNLFPVGLTFGLVAGWFEEIGWTGYAYPRMRARLGALAGAVLLGGLWGLWHLPVVDSLGAAHPHGRFWIAFFLAFVAVLAAIRVIIAWLYVNTGSVLLAQLMHASSTGCLVTLGAAHTSPAQETLWYAVYAGVLWTGVAGVALASGTRLARTAGVERKPTQRRRPVVQDAVPPSGHSRWKHTPAQASSTNANQRPESLSQRTCSRRQQLSQDSDRSTRHRCRPSRAEDSTPRRAIHAVIPRRRK